MKTIRRSASVPGLPLIVALALVLILFGIGSQVLPGFASGYSINATLTLAAFLGVAAAGETLVILLGGIDLSVPYLIGLGDVMVAELTQRGWPFWESVPLVLLLAATIGGVSGLISARLGVHPLIVTLGMGYLTQGAYQLSTGGRPSGAAPAWLGAAVAPGSTTGPIPLAPVVIAWIVFTGVVVLVLRRSVFGKRLYAVGSNPTAARLSHISPVVTWTAAFALSGMLAALAGVLQLGFTGSAYATVGDPYLFLAIGAVVVGGTSLLGGKGGYGATFVGAVLLTELSTLLRGGGFSDAFVQVVLGLIIAVVVTIYGREAHVRTRI